MQLRAARADMGIERAELAKRADVRPYHVESAEKGDRAQRIDEEIYWRIFLAVHPRLGEGPEDFQEWIVNCRRVPTVLLERLRENPELVRRCLQLSTEDS